MASIDTPEFIAEIQARERAEEKGRMDRKLGFVSMASSDATRTAQFGSPLQAAVLRRQFTDVNDIRRFIEAGNATLTIVSRKTGTRFTVKFQRPDPQPGRARPVFVKVLTGADNEADYSFAGTIWPQGGSSSYSYKHSAKSPLSADAPSVRAVLWLLMHVAAGNARSIFEQCEVWHEGRCGRCGRKLTVPDSIAAGFGPDCAGK